PPPDCRSADDGRRASSGPDRPDCPRPAGSAAAGFRSSSRKLQEEGRTPADFALGPHPAAHSRDGLSHQGEPDAGARIVLGTMQALENVEDAVMVLHVESDAVVTHPQQNPAVARARTDLDARGGARAAELDGVLEQIAQRQREA